ncbi:MAG TPA: hypothetical protein DC047_12625 [Blastocatellia bacterium]|nr:hypothetical protein [Blastocatellia bacterium]
MFNIQKAVSRLDYAPKLKEIQVTDIKKGIGVFTPKPDKPVSFAALKETLKKAGYALAAANITLVGKLIKEDKAWALIVPASGQRFVLSGSDLDKVIVGLAADSAVEIKGDWKTVVEGTSSHEVIVPNSAILAQSTSAPRVAFFGTNRPRPSMRFVSAKFVASDADPFAYVAEASELPGTTAKPAAPIRVTSPGLTVYKGGAVTPRLYFIHQHLGNLSVDRQLLDVSVSYTPSPRVQLEIEVPVSRTSFANGTTSGSGTGLGNITAWSKYRFFRKVKTYGDRQAAVRFGLELPTGKKDAPTQLQLNVPAFVRQQLTPISGGLSPHFDLAFSQAGGRFIFGGNAEAILRTERDGFRMGHEVRVNTDTEYVLLPRHYAAPGHELFLIMETTFVHRAPGRLAGASVSGSNSTEYYLAPGLQYAAAPQFVIEGSLQFPLVRNTGPLVLRTDRNILLGMKYLF